MNARRIGALILVVLLVLLGLLWVRSQRGAEQVGEAPTTQAAALQQLEADSQGPVNVTFYDGFPGFVQADVPVSGDNPVERAENFLARYRALYLQGHPDLDLELLDQRGQSVVFYQTYKGLRVYAAEIVVSLQQENVFTTVGNLLSADVERQNLDIIPAIAPQDSVAYAEEALGMQGARVLGEPELVVFNPSFVRDAPVELYLAWQVTLSDGAEIQALIDAHNGDLLFSQPLSLGGFDLDMQDAENEANATDDSCFNLSNDTDVGDEGWFNPDYNNDSDATVGYQAAQDAYNYFLVALGRDSYDGSGGQIEVFIHATVDNASWSSYCELLQFNSGWMDMDVMGHELTHGVISETSDLIYAYQSGALNESYADVFGAVADQFSENPPNWTVAEDRTNGMGAIRSLANPSGFGDPQHMSQYVGGLSNDKVGDYGGVHTNSGIPNYAAYLIAAGADDLPIQGLVVPSFQDQPVYDIDGIGVTKMTQLYYLMMISLPSNANFSMMSNLTMAFAAAWAQNNTNGFTQDDLCSVRNAFYTVGLYAYLDLDCDGTPDGSDNDDDDDGVLDHEDNCRTVPNPNQKDANHDNIGDACQPDADGDGIPAGGGFYGDNCPGVYNPDQTDANFNGIGAACDPTEDEDFDDDGINNDVDNCVFSFNPGQENVDPQNDDDGDACDPDGDGDGISNDDDNCPFTPNADQANTDGDGAGDACDQCAEDSDVNAWSSGFPELGIDPKPYVKDSDGDGIPDACDENRILISSQEHMIIQSNMGNQAGRVNGAPGDHLLLPLPACPPQAEGSGLPDQAQLVLTGLDPNIGLMLINGAGFGAGKPQQVEDEVYLGLRARGGDSYFLEMVLGPDYPAGESQFEIRMNCDQIEEVPTIQATPTLELELIAIPNQTLNCRYGNSSSLFDIADTLMQGEEYMPIGRGPDGLWLQFLGPTFAEPCWALTESLALLLNGQPVDLAEVPESVLPTVPYPPAPTSTPTPTPTPEPTPTPAPECSDGIDNDGDGAVDMNDGRCTSPSDNSESG